MRDVVVLGTDLLGDCVIFENFCEVGTGAFQGAFVLLHWRVILQDLVSCGQYHDGKNKYMQLFPARAPTSDHSHRRGGGTELIYRLQLESR